MNSYLIKIKLNVQNSYPRLNDCNENCSEMATFYYQELGVIYAEERSCSDLLVLYV